MGAEIIMTEEVRDEVEMMSEIDDEIMTVMLLRAAASEGAMMANIDVLVNVLHI
jgi:hypothetical protein